MANHRIKMTQLQRLISYRLSGKSKRWIARQLEISRTTVDTYLAYLHAEIGSDLSPLLSWEPQALERLVNPRQATTLQALEALFPHYQKELQKVGVTRMILWEKYCLTTSQAVTYSRFCYYFRRWEATQKVVMHLEHKAGDKLYIDFAGENYISFIRKPSKNKFWKYL